MPLPVRHAVHRPRGLDLLTRPHRITLLEQLGERGASTFRNRLLKLLGKISEGDVGVNGLDVTKQLVGQSARP